MFELENPLFPGMVSLAIILLVVAITRKKGGAGDPPQRKVLVFSIIGVAAVLLLGLAAVFVTSGSPI